MHSLRSRPPHLGGRRKIFDLFRGMGQCHFPHVMSRECAGRWRALARTPLREARRLPHEKKRPGRRRVPASRKVAASYSPACAVPSATAGLTSLFGMGRGGSPYGKRWIPVFITALMSCYQRPAGPLRPFAGYGKKRNMGGNALRAAREGRS